MNLIQILPNLGKKEFLENPNVKAAFPNGLPRDFYQGLSWSGLKWTDKWRYDLPKRNDYLEYQQIAGDNLSNDSN